MAKNPKVTIYNGGFAVVRLVEEIDVDKEGVHTLEGVASEIDTTSVKVRGLDGRVEVVEQNYKYDLVAGDKLLERCVGKNIEATRNIGNGEELLEGMLLSYSGGKVIVDTDRGLQVFTPTGFTLPEDATEGLILRPTLEWQLRTENAGVQSLEVSYLTNGIRWEADYVVALSADESEMGLQGWVNITNNSGQTFEAADVKLVAGEVKRAQQKQAMRAMALESFADDGSGAFQEEQLADYHMYKLQRPATIADKEQKQIGLLSGEGIGVTKRYELNRALKVAVYLSFENSADNNLGQPLPAGRIRFFKPDSDDLLQFIGEANIKNTPNGETVKDLHIGNAFDIVAETRVTQQARTNTYAESTVEYIVSNHKSEEVTVEVPFNVGANTKISLVNQLGPGVELTTPSANETVVEVTIPANSKQTFEVFTRQVYTR